MAHSQYVTHIRSKISALKQEPVPEGFKKVSDFKIKLMESAISASKEDDD